MYTVKKQPLFFRHIKKYIFFIFVFSLIYSSGVCASSLEQFAADQAKELFGSESTSTQLTTYQDAFGNDTVYLFLVHKDSSVAPNNYLQTVEDGQELVSEGEVLVQNGFQKEG